MNKVLNVAEKPSVARGITDILSYGRKKAEFSNSKTNQVFSLVSSLEGQPCKMYFTSVRGHLMELEFDIKYRNWQRTPMEDIFEAPILSAVSKNCKDIEKNLLHYSKLRSNCVRAIRRAVFSAVTKSDIENACNLLRNPNPHLAHAVEARQEIDLRIGASITRFMTVHYRHEINTEAKVLSYGPCQMPTLGFIVERFNKIEAFVPEPFWSIQLHVEKDGNTNVFLWDRGRLFDRLASISLYEACLENPMVKVTHINNKSVKKHPPLPLDTVEMHKDATRFLNISSHEGMQLAESLYNKGYISYPRTETNVFPGSMNLMNIVNIFTEHPNFGNYAKKLVQGGTIKPRKGKKNDEAHPPIHPVKSLRREEAECEKTWKLYEYIVRRFLACCSPPAMGDESVAFLDVAGEGFHSKGLVVRERNWLDVYPYASWNGRFIPAFTVGEEFLPQKILLAESKTKPPGLLTETNLIDLMSKHGIGTDATMHEHIQKVQERQYAKKEPNFTLLPTNLGKAIYKAFKEYRHVSIDLTKPNLRASMERDMCQIASGEKKKNDVISHYSREMKKIFLNIKNNIAAFDNAMLALRGVNPDASPMPSSAG
ncbi:hypothetical protein BgAZ_102740 [Babesia gibsoni]|uniref:DNA topoisomerase n=1 Tax=Babesia gibsoni TaxID=33632 RepID=A0AAD8PFA5_BABGI|nr:hypothetical protein BgAZ_102740 [Babesia gibsoni]